MVFCEDDGFELDLNPSRYSSISIQILKSFKFGYCLRKLVRSLIYKGLFLAHLIIHVQKGKFNLFSSHIALAPELNWSFSYCVVIFFTKHSVYLVLVVVEYLNLSSKWSKPTLNLFNMLLWIMFMTSSWHNWENRYVPFLYNGMI